MKSNNPVNFDVIPNVAYYIFDCHMSWVDPQPIAGNNPICQKGYKARGRFVALFLSA
jgi:hypothetical protein